MKWLTLRPGEAYSVTLAPLRELFLLREDDGTWTLWWGQWIKDNPKPVNEKTLGSGMTFEAAVKRGNEYLQWYFRKWKGVGRG